MDTREPINDFTFLPTGIEALNKILSMDTSSCGVPIGRGKTREDLETPVILISGSTGTGKTSLALQIAFSAAREGWIPCFYSLEQTTLSLQNLVSDFGFFESEPDAESSAPFPKVSFCDPAQVRYENSATLYSAHDIQKCVAETSAGSGDKRIHLCHLSPRPITDIDNQTVFEKRLAELHHMLKKVDDEIPKDQKIAFFIDSLNAFSSAPLNRSEIYQIFSLFRAYHVPAILTMEHSQNSQDGAELTYHETAKFLADIAIGLSKESFRGHLNYYLEIEKSRVSRQSFGKHLYKIRTRQNAAKMELDPRTGIVVYPSIHSILSSVQGKPKLNDRPRFLVCESEHDDFFHIMQNTHVYQGEFLTIMGPPGTHKLALGMNLSMGHLENTPSHLLIINFGGSGDFRFEGVAWTANRLHCRGLRPKKIGSKHMKFWCTEYECQTLDTGQRAFATILTFQIGHLTPEECFYIVENITNNKDGERETFTSVLLSDTAELCSGFPLLASDSLFLPALVELFKSRNLVSVCIGVDTSHSDLNADINFALSSRADYRIVMSHYPEKAVLYREIVEGRSAEGSQGGLNQQLVSLVIDNVSGKHYGREPRWLRVEESTDAEGNIQKVLHCSLKPEVGGYTP